MSYFSYEARNNDGQLIAGTIVAESIEHAGQLLCDRNLFVIRMATEKSKGTSADAGGYATRSQLAWCLSQLAIMVETRIRLVDALDCLARQASQPHLKVLLETISKRVQEGRPLSEAMQMHPRSFPTSLVALIRASEMSGTMGQMLQRSSTYLLHDLQVLKRVRAAMAYPIFMFVLCLGVTGFLLTVILPRFAMVFSNRGAILPFPTRVLMATSDNLRIHWHWWIGTVAVVLVVSWIYSRTKTARRQRDFILISTPILSPIFKTLFLARTFRAMAILLEAGVSMIDIMKIINDLITNSYYRELWKSVDSEIQKGNRMAGPLLASNLIPESIGHMIESGDHSGKLPLVFSRLAEFLEEEYDQIVKSTTQFIEPFMILFMGTIIGFVACSLMLPLFQASRVIAR